jgi:hypothetical protein
LSVCVTNAYVLSVRSTPPLYRNHGHRVGTSRTARGGGAFREHVTYIEVNLFFNLISKAVYKTQTPPVYQISF